MKPSVLLSLCILLSTLVAKLQLGNAIGEAPASRCPWKLELPVTVTKLELGNEGNEEASFSLGMRERLELGNEGKA